MIAASVAIFVSIGVGLIIVQQQDVENTTLLQSNLDTSHSLMIQKVRNIAGLKTAFGLAADGNNPCFGKSGGGGCAALILPATNPLPPMDAADVTHHDVCVDPPKCYVISNVTYTTSCTVTRCDSITLSVQTSPSTTATSRGQYAKLRKTDITIPGFMFANKMGINFACGASTATLPQTIDYKTLDMSCGPASLGTPVPCANSMPLTYFDDTSKICQSSVTVSCPNGVNRAGIFSGQSGCT
jgi:hypothetical protein